MQQPQLFLSSFLFPWISAYTFSYSVLIVVCALDGGSRRVRDDDERERERMERRRLQEEKEEEKEKIREGEAIKVGTFIPDLSDIQFLKAFTTMYILNLL